MAATQPGLIPGGTDPALAALSAQQHPHDDSEEVLAHDLGGAREGGILGDRRKSVPLSVRSGYTMTTEGGGQSVYADANESLNGGGGGSTGGVGGGHHLLSDTLAGNYSQATITRSETGDSYFYSDAGEQSRVGFGGDTDSLAGYHSEDDPTIAHPLGISRDPTLQVFPSLPKTTTTNISEPAKTTATDVPGIGREVTHESASTSDVPNPSPAQNGSPSELTSSEASGTDAQAASGDNIAISQPHKHEENVAVGSAAAVAGAGAAVLGLASISHKDSTPSSTPNEKLYSASASSSSGEKVAAKELNEKNTKEKDEASSGSGLGSGGSDSEIIDDPELKGLTDEQRRIVAEQVSTQKRPQASFFELYRFSTKFELFLCGLGVLFAVVAGAAQPLMTVVFGNLTTAFTAYASVSSSGNVAAIAQAKTALFSQVNQDVLYLVYIGIGMFAATFTYMATFIVTGEASTRRVRERYLQAVLRQNVAFFDKMGAGEVTTRIQTDTHLIQEGISDKVPITVMFVSTFISGFIVALVRNWRLALVVSTIIPVIAGAGGGMNKFVSEYQRQMLEATAEGGTLAEEVISSVRNAHAFGTQKKLTAMYDVKNEKTMAFGLKSATVTGFGMGVFFFVIYSAYALAFYYGTTLIIQGRATSGQIVNVFFAILIGAFSLAQIAPELQAIAFARGAATSIFATIDRVPVIDSASTEGLQPESIGGVLQLDNIDFIYPARPSVQVLYNFSAIFPTGKMTALVGASGSGKSTIVGLIERFYDPVGGSVKLDGVELKDLNVKWLRSHIGLVSQEPTLFATTVAGNIEHGLIGTRFAAETSEQKRKRVIEAAVEANADGFISALPEGYDTMIGERGMLLSGGQKQRIAIARAIVGDPQILLLDEATSALDTASESIVQDALDKASAGRTTITIAHRLSTIKDADQIIVLSAGHILESAMSSGEGRAHDILLQNPEGAYSRLVSAQRFREEAVDDDDSDAEGEEKAPATMTREQAEEAARKEKPAFENLKRSGTGRSAASEALEQKRQGDIEAGENKKKHSFPYLFKRMLTINKARKWDYILGTIGAVASGCVYPVFGIIFGGVIGVFSEPIEGGRLRSGGNRYALYCFIIALIATVCITTQTYLFSRSSEHLSRILRVSAFAAILRQDIAYFDKEENSTGHLTSSISDWAQKINGLFGQTLGVILQSCFTLIVGSIVGLSYGWRVALVGIACFPFTIAAGIIRLRVVVLKDGKNKLAHEHSAQMACEAAGAIRTVASLTRENDCCELYSKELDAPMRNSNRVAIYANGLYSLSQALTFWVIGLIFWYGSHQLADGKLSSRQFFTALISIVFGSIQAGNVFNFVPDMSKARGAASDVCYLLDAVPEIDAENPEGKVLTHSEGHIKFTDVHFRYPTRPHVRVLRGLELEVLPGQFIAIVGPSGCGKSTLIQLVERFYDPLAGTVSVDGNDISQLNIQSYRDQISLVSQEPTLYAGTVKFNITLGATVPAEQVTQEQIEQACKDANIHDFVLSLPDGYETEVGGKGAQLSGGQKQRIAIARALIRNPKILLLDEATSALDSESEKVVQKALDQAAKGRSTIAVAHRLSTIQGADLILVLRDGKVVEKGKHFELLAKKGVYFELVAQQSLEKRT